MLRAVIFDFDGVIADTEPLHFAAFNKVLAQHGLKITQTDYYNKYLGYTDVDCTRAMAEDFKITLNVNEIEELLRRKAEVFGELAAGGGGIIEAVPEFLGMLKQNNISTAICSGALLSDIKLVLGGSDLWKYFGTLITAENVKKGKPDPEGLLLALQRLNQTEEEKILPAQCIVIEDSHWGLEAAQRAKMHTIAVTNTYPAGELSMAEKIVDTLTEVTIEDLHQLCK